MTKESIIEEIIEGILSFRIIPFFGAGMSIPAGAADWPGLINELRSGIQTEETDYLKVAQLYEEKFGRPALLEKLIKLCTLQEKSSSTLRNHMRILVMNPPIIYTTNYDDALETAGELLKRDYYRIIGLKDIVNMPHGARQIIKFHGDFSDPDSIVFTQQDYDKRLKIERNPLDVLFRAHILGKSVLFVGYSFSDKNIDHIYSLHTELYGSQALNRSYIISFRPNPQREAELRAKNIITLVLDSQDELAELLNRMGEVVAEKRVDRSFDDMNASFVTTVVTDFELSDIRRVFEEGNLPAENLAEKLRMCIEMREIPSDVENEMVEFIVKVLEGDYDREIKKQIAFAFHNIQFKKSESVLKVGFGLIPLTEFDDCRVSLEIPFGLDVLMMISMKFGDAFNADESRRCMAVVILTYLEALRSEHAKTEFRHIDRLLDALKETGYEDFDETELAGFSPENVQSLLNYYFQTHGNTLKNRFTFKSFRSRKSGTDIQKHMLSMLPTNIFK
ncbi:SIR2 family protein [Mucilaginibacter sp.]|uniref:SIR2 family protein n=1 Tax=Mucilaginibacter sp. TaxID=1882438 RepID=UPI0035BBD278